MLNILLIVIIVFSTTFFSTLAQAKSIVVIGDSISASYGFEEQHGWVALLEQKLITSHPDFTMHNASISGDTTAGGLARLPRLLKQYQPTIVILELGANDGLRGMSIKAMQENLSAIIKRSKKSGAQVLLLSMRIPSNYGKRYTDMFYNSYQKLASKHNISVVPFILEEIALDKSRMQQDRLHPNKKAQPIIANHISPYLIKLISSTKYTPVNKQRE
ncbi:MAG: arylesterase [Gammaproteobacteria bacterium]|nr:MAG: arylesterase [Gammaproteobacteria bacterium]